MFPLIVTPNHQKITTQLMTIIIKNQQKYQPIIKILTRALMKDRNLQEAQPNHRNNKHKISRYALVFERDSNKRKLKDK